MRINNTAKSRLIRGRNNLGGLGRNRRRTKAIPVSVSCFVIGGTAMAMLLGCVNTTTDALPTMEFRNTVRRDIILICGGGGGGVCFVVSMMV